MPKGFIRVTDKITDERFLINLNDISFVREVKREDCCVIKLKSKDKLVLQVKESFDLIEIMEEE